jgi:hypothetical protein
VRDRSSKSRLAGAAWGLLNAFGTFTEGMDLVDSAWRALPKNMRSKSFHKGRYVRPAWWKRARDVLANWRHIDGERFVKNLLANQMEDWYYGMRSQFHRFGQRGPRPGYQWREIEEAQPRIDFDAIVDQIFDAIRGRG